MQIFCYFVEPASYTVNLISAIHKKLNINYIFFQENQSVSVSLRAASNPILKDLKIFKRFKFIFNTLYRNELIIINGYSNYVFFALFFLNLFFFRKRSIAIESDTPLSIPSNPLKRIFKKILLQFIFRKRWIFGLPGGSLSHKSNFSYYKMEDSRIFLLPMVVDHTKYNLIKTIDSKIFNLLYVGRLVSEKNILFLTRSFNTWAIDKENVRLSIVGDGPLIDKLRSINTLNKIDFYGKVPHEQISEFLALADVLVLPSKYEPWGLVVNEAMASSTPVIVSSKVGASEDLVKNKNTGLIFDTNDFEGLLKCFDKFYYNKELRLQYGKNASNLISNFWNYSLYEENLTSFINYLKINEKPKKSR